MTTVQLIPVAKIRVLNTSERQRIQPALRFLGGNDGPSASFLHMESPLGNLVVNLGPAKSRLKGELLDRVAQLGWEQWMRHGGLSRVHVDTPIIRTRKGLA